MDKIIVEIYKQVIPENYVGKTSITIHYKKKCELDVDIIINSLKNNESLDIKENGK